MLTSNDVCYWDDQEEEVFCLSLLESCLPCIVLGFHRAAPHHASSLVQLFNAEYYKHIV